MTPGTGAPADRPCVLVVVGAPGTPEYGSQFGQWAGQWQAAAAKAGAESIMIGTSGAGGDDRERLRAALAEKAAATGKETGTPNTAREPLWIVLIGHGTSDGREAKFNLRGPDVTDVELARNGRADQAADRCTRLHVGQRTVPEPALRRGPGDRHRGQEWARAELRPLRPVHRRGDRRPVADLDKDGQVTRSSKHSSRGQQPSPTTITARARNWRASTPCSTTTATRLTADWFRGVRSHPQCAKDGAALDGLRAHQHHLIPSDRERDIPPAVRQRRNQLELSVAALRDEKNKLGAEEYYQRLEPLLVELARLYRDLQASSPSQGTTSP